MGKMSETTTHTNSSKQQLQPADLSYLGNAIFIYFKKYYISHTQVIEIVITLCNLLVSFTIWGAMTFSWDISLMGINWKKYL